MTQDTELAQEEQLTQTTKLKFYTSETTGQLISFVYITKTGLLKGVREDSDRNKKIVVLSPELKDSLKPNVLYDVELADMRSGKGYIVKSATPVLFQASVNKRIIPRKVYKVSAKFGNKAIFFDPLGGKSDSSRTLQGALKALEAREDIADKELVIADFKEKCLELLRRMKEDGLDSRLYDKKYMIVGFEKKGWMVSA
mgnify:CR=1 FL=1|jgi:hypothetical protein